MKLRRNRRHGTTIYRSDAAAESSPSTSHGDHIEESSSDTQVIENENSTEEYRRWRQSLYQKIEAMKLRRNRRQGIAIRQHQDAAAKSPPSTFQVDHLAEVASMTLPTSAV